MAAAHRSWQSRRWRVREAYGADAAQMVRENPYRLADKIYGIGFLTADSLRVMLGIGGTSPFRLHAALKYVLGLVARTEGHVYLPLAELVDRTARQLDEQRAAGAYTWPSTYSCLMAVATPAPGSPRRIAFRHRRADSCAIG